MTLWETMLSSIVSEYETFPETFLRQPVIKYTVHPNCQSLAVEYFKEMSKDSFFAEVLLPKMYDSPVGTPFEFKLLPACSPLTVQHVYHLNVMREHLNVFVPESEISQIVEIGGGYGNLCRLINNFGYAGKYTIVDFDPMLEIQKRYLEQNEITNVCFSTLDSMQRPTDTSLLVATFSVNEMPMEDRKVLEGHYSDFDYLFFAYNAVFDGINNVEYFNDLKMSLESQFEITHVKDQFKSSWFMLCKNNDQK